MGEAEPGRVVRQNNLPGARAGGEGSLLMVRP